MAEGRKEYKKLRLPLLPVGRWVGLPAGETSDDNITSQKTTSGEALRALRNHQNRWFYGGLDNLKTRKAERNNFGGLTKALYTAIPTRGQLHALEEGAIAHEVLIRPNIALIVKASPKGQVQAKEKPDNPTDKVTFDKDVLGRKMTDWEYLMWLHHDFSMTGHPEPKCTLELLTRSPKFTKSPELTRKIEDYIKRCVTCAQGKPMQQKSYRMLQPLPIPNRPWQNIAMDFIVKLPPSRDSSEPGNPEYNLV